ncbi:MAG: hypothetical protein ACOC5U_05215, partial [Candidatus Aminicenantaceae bacterium]
MSKILPSGEGPQEAVIDFLKQVLEKNCCDFVLVPVKGPDEKSYSWVLLKDQTLLDQADPLPPVMTVQGGAALSSLTKHGGMGLKTAAVMRPCEIRAAVELFKLKQVELEDVILISIDCPGALPLAGYMDDPEEKSNQFKTVLEKWEPSEALRSVCRICHRFSLPFLLPSFPQESPAKENDGEAAPDLHVGIGKENDSIYLIPVTSKGESVMDQLGFSREDSLKDWESKIDKIGRRKQEEKELFSREWAAKLQGPDGFADSFDECINCHNCMR